MGIGPIRQLLMPAAPTNPLTLDTGLFRPGMRVAVAVSGGADSVALLLSLLSEREKLGLVLSVAHLNHGIRGAEADGDAQFVAELAAKFDLPLHLHRVDTPGSARSNHESLEEAARNLRYAWFHALITSGLVDVVATAHTLDDQAETVLHKFLRGAWTEGLSGIHPALAANSGYSISRQRLAIVRPMLGVRRSEVEAWLQSLGQPWREDSTNQEDAYTRNRLRHQLLPELATYNPKIHAHLAQLATLGRDEEAYWQAELARLLPSLLLPGKAVRGGGRAASTRPGEGSVSLEIERLRSFATALQRRILRAAARQLGVSLNFEQTERLMSMCGFGLDSSQKLAKAEHLTAELRVERTPRELRLLRSDPSGPLPIQIEYSLPIPGEVVAAAYGLRLRAEIRSPGLVAGPGASLRPARPGDRVKLRYSRGPKRVKEVLERMGVAAADRKNWPVLEWRGQILWMRGAQVECEAATAAGLVLTEEALPPGGMIKVPWVPK
jgi:tRNA(Ile)-lysidine synthase